MNKHTDTPEKTPKTALKTAYYLICACGCGQVSEELGKDYIRLRKGQKWYKEGCQDSREIVQEFKGGFVVKEEDF